MIAESAYLRALKGVGVVVAAIAEVSAPRRDAAARTVPSAKIYATHGKMLSIEKNLDALIVAAPPLHHADAVLAGLKRHLHVLCEKPLTLDRAAFEVIRSESVARNLTVYSVNNWAYSPQWSRLLELAPERLGAVRHAEIRVLRTQPSVSALPGDWRKDPAVSGGGILVDHGWHNLYLMRRLLGPETRLVSCVLSHDGAVDDAATVFLAAPGKTGTMHLSWKAVERSNYAFAAGERGTVELRDDLLLVKTEGGEETIRFHERLSAGSAHPEWLVAMWPSFEAECSGRGRGDNLSEAAFCLESVRAAYSGAYNGREPARA